MVFRKQISEFGNYIDENNHRWEIISCIRTESLEQVQIGTTIEEIDGQQVEVPIYEQRVVINKGWDEFASIEEAAKSYSLTYSPLKEVI